MVVVPDEYAHADEGQQELKSYDDDVYHNVCILINSPEYLKKGEYCLTTDYP